MKANQEIRNLISSNRLRNWEVADAIGIADTTLSVWLRKELTDDRKERTLKAIDELINE